MHPKISEGGVDLGSKILAISSLELDIENCTTTDFMLRSRSMYGGETTSLPRVLITVG
jgi:hypothetical protein